MNAQEAYKLACQTRRQLTTGRITRREYVNTYQTVNRNGFGKQWRAALVAYPVIAGRGKFG